MSQSPLAPGESEELDAYLKSWQMLNRMIEKGRSFSGHERNCCFLNIGNGPFADVSATSGIDWADDTRGIAIVDWDCDGDLDFWTSNRSAPRVRLMRNNRPASSQFVALRLRGTAPGCNRDAIGARVQLWLDVRDDAKIADVKNKATKRKRIKTLYAGNGFLSQSSKWIHFGLQPEETINRVEVHWPDGQQETFRKIQPGRFYRVTQGQGAAPISVEPTSDLQPTLAANGPLSTPEGTDAARIVLARRQLLPKIEYTSFAGELVTLDDLSGPILINLWADWCRPCVSELQDLVQYAEPLKETGLSIVALHVGDSQSNRDQVSKVATALLERLQFHHTAGVAGNDTIKMLDTVCDLSLSLHPKLPLPSSFLLDRDRRLCVIYKGPVQVEQLIRDVSSIAAVDEKWIQPEASSAGVWLNAPDSYESLQLAKRLLKEGHVEEAIDYVTQSIDHATELAAKQIGPDTYLAAMCHVLGTIHRSNGQLPQAIAAYQQALKADADHWAAHFDLGTIYLKQSQHELAQHYLVEALRLEPNDADVLNKLALIQLEKKQPVKAVSLLEKSLALEPKNPAALRNLATIYLRTGNNRQAVTNLTKLLQLEPSDAALHLEMGNALYHLSRHQSALEEYRVALKLRPNWIAPMNSIAWLLATRGHSTAEEIDESLQLSNLAVQISGGSHPTTLDTLAAALASAGRFDEAVATAKRAVEIAGKVDKLKPLASKIRKRVSLYRQQRPYREDIDRNSSD